MIIGEVEKSGAWDLREFLSLKDKEFEGDGLAFIIDLRRHFFFPLSILYHLKI